MPRFVLIRLGVRNDPSERTHVLAFSTETENTLLYLLNNMR